MCYYCGDLSGIEKIFRNSVCNHCGKDLKVCLNCKHYSKGAHWDCKETIPEEVKDKDRANFCDYFSYEDKIDSSRQEKFKKDIENARSIFLNLFDNE